MMQHEGNHPIGDVSFLPACSEDPKGLVSLSLIFQYFFLIPTIAVKKQTKLPQARRPAVTCARK